MMLRDMLRKWIKPAEKDEQLKDAAQRETRRIIADVRALELSIERASRRSMDELERDLQRKYQHLGNQ